MPEIDQIVRSKRKTIALVIQRDGALIVRAPLRMPEKAIREMVAQKADWIARAQAKMRANPPIAGTYKFIDGEKFLLMGARHPLKIVKNQRANLTFEAGTIFLAEKAHPRAREAFTLWYRKLAATLLPGRVEALARKHGFKPGKIRITSARTRWGSCSSTGTISLTWRLIMAPLEVIDYVIIHELAHLDIKNHSKTFWQAVAILLPEYKKQLAWLKNNGQTLDI